MEYVIEGAKTTSGTRKIPMFEGAYECFRRIIANRKKVSQHTFCSNMAKSGMNPKTLQYIMGHSDIGVTLNTYIHVQYEDARQEMSEVCESKPKRKSAM